MLVCNPLGRKKYLCYSGGGACALNLVSNFDDSVSSFVVCWGFAALVDLNVVTSQDDFGIGVGGKIDIYQRKRRNTIVFVATDFDDRGVHGASSSERHGITDWVHGMLADLLHMFDKDICVVGPRIVNLELDGVGRIWICWFFDNEAIQDRLALG